MLSDKHFTKQEHKFNFDMKTKNRRLTDIKRGQQYFRKIDHLAENQWISNAPRQEHKRNNMVLRPITDSVYSKLQSERLMQDFGANGAQNKQGRVQSEKQPLTEGKRIYAAEVALANRTSSMTTPTSKFGLSQDSLSRAPESTRRPMERVLRQEGHVYNQYGSTYTHLDSLTELKKRDFEPKFEPFRFRDSTQRLVKPVPKKSIPMSRVAESDDRCRQMKISTDFRSSRNGTVKVIRPPDPLPDVPKCSVVDIAFDDQVLKTEKTFLLLRRVDNLLHPDRKERLSSLGSSERDFPPSKSPCASDLTDPPLDFLQIRDEARGPQREVYFPENDKLSSTPVYSALYRNVPVYHSRVKMKILSFEEFLRELAVTPMDVIRKCRIWVNSCPDFVYREK